MQRCLLYLFALAFIQQVTSRECVTYTGMKLCNTNTCPDDYHMCNVYDKPLITRNHRVGEYGELEHAYITSLTQHGEDCRNNHEELRYSITTTDYELSNEEYCNFDNSLVAYGEGKRIGECVFCYCEPSRSRCINMCEYSSASYIVNDYAKPSTFIPTRPRKREQHQYTCGESDTIEHIACCKNSRCSMKHCISCQSYGRKEQCAQCQENSYFFRGFNTKCYTLDEIKLLCDNYYQIDSITQQFICLPCIQGTLNTDERTNQTSCQCYDGFFGSKCDKNYDRLFCNSNGVYHTEDEICICNSGFTGINCEKRTDYECINGVYDSITDGCICNKGFHGKNCEIEIPCHHGNIIDTVCLCNEGFSGESCEIFIRETREEREHKEQLLNEYLHRECKQGSFDEASKTCVCAHGYSGNDCSIELCKHGKYDYRSDTCICNEGYYGSTCEKSCMRDCNYNGNICNENRVCECSDGWYGTRCEFVKLASPNITIASTFTMDINRVTSESPDIIEDIIMDSMQLEVISCYASKCLPFKLLHNESFIDRIGRRNLNSESSNTTTVIEISFAQTIVNHTLNESIYVYPNNNQSLSYYGGSETVLVHIGTERENFFYIESHQSNTINNEPDIDIVIDDGTDSTDTSDDPPINANNSDDTENESFIKKLYSNIVFIGCGLGGLIVSLIVVRIIRKKRRTLPRKNFNTPNQQRVVFTTNSVYNKGLPKSFAPSNRKLIATAELHQQA